MWYLKICDEAKGLLALLSNETFSEEIKQVQAELIQAAIDLGVNLKPNIQPTKPTHDSIHSGGYWSTKE